MIDPTTGNATGGFLPNDQVPATLLPVVKRMFDEQVPVLLETARLLKQWVQDNPDSQEIPRAIGTLRYQIGDMEEERLAFPFNLWMWQRPHDLYQGLSADDRRAVDGLLTPEQAAALGAPLGVRVQRQNNKLMRE